MDLGTAPPPVERGSEMALKQVVKGKLLIRYSENKFGRVYTIMPKGFWSCVITVSQDPGWKEPKITWASGGVDGTLIQDETVENFIAGLKEAIRVYKRWDKGMRDERDKV